MHNENWDDLRYVLKVVDCGSVLQASKSLGVNHATVLRHIASFEERHGAAVFERTAHGYRVLPDRIHVIQAAQDAEAAMHKVSRLASGGRQALRGTVRVASTDSLCMMVLPKFVAQMSAKDDDVEITLLSGNMHMDVLRDQAHIVVRPALKLTSDLIGKVVAYLNFAAYAASEKADKWYALTGPLSRSVAAQWLTDEVPNDLLIAGSDSFLTLRELAAVGSGIAILPSFVGDNDPRLKKLDKAMPSMSVPIWVAHHAESTVTLPMKAVQDGLSAFFGQPWTG